MKFQREGAHLGQRDVVKLFYVFADSKTQNIYNNVLLKYNTIPLHHLILNDRSSQYTA